MLAAGSRWLLVRLARPPILQEAIVPGLVCALPLSPPCCLFSTSSSSQPVTHGHDATLPGGSSPARSLPSHDEPPLQPVEPSQPSSWSHPIASGSRTTTHSDAATSARATRRAAARADKPPLPQAEGQFVGRVRLRAHGGKGGDGAIAWEAAARGGHLYAAGGNGGHGGAVLLRATAGRASLLGVQSVQHAPAGVGGGRQGCHGARSPDRVIEVPLGTVVRRLPTPTKPGHEGSSAADTAHAAAAVAAAVDESVPEFGEGEDPEQWDEEEADRDAAASAWRHDGRTVDDDFLDEEGAAGAVRLRQRGSGGSGRHASVDGDDSDDVDGHQAREDASGREEERDSVDDLPIVAELDVEGQEVVVAVGGKGGKGNKAMPHIQGRKPLAERELGEPGGVAHLLLEARLLADVGFVGMPNAGKSTLLSALTAARAKVGDYPFTTLGPQLGTLRFADGTLLALADVPGLLAGAHAGAGRGSTFLRSVERVRCLALVVDLSGGQPGALLALSPWEQLTVLQEELRLYRGGLSRLSSLPVLVIANKLDATVDAAGQLARLKAAAPHPIVPVSAQAQVGLERLRQALRVLAATPSPPPPVPQTPPVASWRASAGAAPSAPRQPRTTSGRVA